MSITYQRMGERRVYHRRGTIVLFFFCFFGLAIQGNAEEVQTFCGKTCGLWPKLCATGTVCVKVCQIPQRLLKVCRNNKVPLDSVIPDIPFTKQQFCESLCSEFPLMCNAMTYCIQICGADPGMLKSCIHDGKPVDTARPRIMG